MEANARFLLIGALNGFLAVVLGAFGAHGLKARLSEQALAVWQTGVQYHTTHALALILVALLYQTGRRCHLTAAGWLFAVGILLFSGSLYGLALGGPRWLGPVTPLGGTAFLLGWLALACSAVKKCATDRQGN